jgi:hypothetical protein
MPFIPTSHPVFSKTLTLHKSRGRLQLSSRSRATTIHQIRRRYTCGYSKRDIAHRSDMYNSVRRKNILEMLVCRHDQKNAGKPNCRPWLNVVSGIFQDPDVINSKDEPTSMCPLHDGNCREHRIGHYLLTVHDTWHSLGPMLDPPEGSFFPSQAAPLNRRLQLKRPGCRCGDVWGCNAGVPADEKSVHVVIT